jgi:glycosyltransferase involved in cell wall biosynthesis
MKPLVSVLIPSRARVGKLKKCIGLLMETATDTDFEILIRLDDDDTDSLPEIKKLELFRPVRCIVGPRYGYTKLDELYYPQLEDEAAGVWVWEANDDMFVVGDWLGELRRVPTRGYIVQPQVSKLNESVYLRNEGAAFPIWPRHAWKEFAEKFPEPFDREGDKLFRSNGWKTWFLKDVMFFHDRAGDEELKAHRAPGMPPLNHRPKAVGITSKHRNEI